MLWYRYYGEDKGIFQGIIQSSDKNYLAFGESNWKSSIDYYYKINNTIGVKNLPCNSIKGSNIYVAKIDHSTGDPIWQYTYGIWTDGNPYTEAVAYDAVETANGGFILCGWLPIGEVPGTRNNLPYRRLFIMKINNQGTLLWITYFGVTPFDRRCEAYSIARNSSTNQYVITGRIESYLDFYTSAAFVGRFDEPNDIAPPNPVFTFVTNTIANSQNRVLAYDVCYNNNGDILVPILYNLYDGLGGSAEGEGKVYKFLSNFSEKTPPSAIYNVVGDLKAYDLKMGIEPTNDGGFAIVTSVPSTNNPRLPPTGCDDWYDVYEWWETDAYIAKFSSSGMKDWEKRFDSHIPRAPDANYNYPADVKKEECLYQIRENPDHNLVIVGNNSNNFDDDYIVKFSSHTDLILHDIVTDKDCGSFMEYKATNSITAGANFVIQQIGGTNFVAGNRITLSPGFHVKSGSTFKATISNNIIEDNEIHPARILYKNISGERENVEENNKDVPSVYYLEQNYPNPFNPTTTIRYGVPKSAKITIKIYDILGSEVMTLIDNLQHSPGKYEKVFNASYLGSGIYIYKIVAGSYVKLRKMILLK